MEKKKENLFDCRCYEKNKVENIATIVERLIFKISWKPDGTKEDSMVDKDRLLRILLNPYVCSCFVRAREEKEGSRAEDPTRLEVLSKHHFDQHRFVTMPLCLSFSSSLSLV